MPLSPLSPIADLAPVRHQDRTDRSSARDDKFVVPGAEPEKARARPADQVSVVPPAAPPAEPVRRVEPVSPVKSANTDAEIQGPPATDAASQVAPTSPSVAIDSTALAPDATGLASSDANTASTPADIAAILQNTAATGVASLIPQPAAVQTQAANAPKTGGTTTSGQTQPPAATSVAGQAPVVQTNGLPHTAITASNSRNAQAGAAGQAAPADDDASSIATVPGGNAAGKAQFGAASTTAAAPTLGNSAATAQQTGGANPQSAATQTAATQSNILAAQAIASNPAPASLPDALPVSQSFETGGVSQNFHAEMRSALNAPTQAAAYTARGATTAQPAVEQVALQITRAVDQNADRMTVHLKPAELGKVTIDMEVQPDNRIIAVISAERAETLELLQRDARSLERALNEAGLKADSGSLEFNMQGEDGTAAHDDNPDSTNAGITLSNHTDTAAEDSGIASGAAPRLVPEGRIDIQV